MSYNSRRKTRRGLTYRQERFVYGDRAPNRLQERLMAERSFENFDDVEILSTVLASTGSPSETQRLAERLLDSFGSLKAVLEARPEQLMAVPGMDRARTGLIAMTIPLTKAWIRGTKEEHVKIRCPDDADGYCRSLLIGERLEKFYVIALNVSGQVIGKRCISTGSLSEVGAYPRLVAEAALNYNAASILLCHNHPGGSCSPSEADIENTRRMASILDDLDIRVLDHVIVGGNESYSLRWHGDFSKKREGKPSGDRNRKAEKAASPREKNTHCYRSIEKEVTEMPYDRKLLGVIISRLRVERGLTQERMSGLAGIARSHLVALENGEKTMRLDTLWRIAEALGAKPSELIHLIEKEGGDS